MRKLIAVAAIALALPASAAAQDAPRGPGGRGMPMLNTVEWLLKSKEEFKATAEQAAKIEEISKKFDSETVKLREEFQKARQEMMGGADRAAVMQKMRPIREELQKKDEAAVAEVLQLLSTEQQATVKQLLESRRNEMRNRGRQGGQRQIQ
jgi:Spy/CpxP family protein refolding chaperone